MHPNFCTAPTPTFALVIYAYIVYTLAFALGTGRGVTDSINGRGAVGLDASSAFASPVASVSATYGYGSAIYGYKAARREAFTSNAYASRTSAGSPGYRDETISSIGPGSVRYATDG